MPVCSGTFYGLRERSSKQKSKRFGGKVHDFADIDFATLTGGRLALKHSNELIN
jgi:hypothetical protein